MLQLAVRETTVKLSNPQNDSSPLPLLMMKMMVVAMLGSIQLRVNHPGQKNILESFKKTIFN